MVQGNEYAGDATGGVPGCIPSDGRSLSLSSDPFFWGWHPCRCPRIDGDKGWYSGYTTLVHIQSVALARASDMQTGRTTEPRPRDTYMSKQPMSIIMAKGEG
jgi:hypothetical protein